MPSARVCLRALLPFALHGLAREADAALGLVLRATLTPPSVLGEVGSVLAEDGGGVLGSVLVWTLSGALVWLTLAFLRARRIADFAGEGVWTAHVFHPLYLRPALTLVAVLAVALQPSFPYAFTLPVALTQDWSLGQDAAALAVLLAGLMPAAFRFPAPRPAALLFLTFLAYSFLTPEWARHWEGHPGNEPKYLRMAVALGHEMTLDAEGVSAPMEELEPRPFWSNLGTALGTVAVESGRMAGALLEGPAVVGKDAIEAARITRQTIRGKQGGVYYVLAPGPSLLLAPALRCDRALNLARGTRGRIAVSVLVFNLLAAALVAAVFVLARDATERSGLAAALALAFAFVPPFLFYSFQFYPEMLGALVLAVVFHRLVFVPEWTTRQAWLVGALLASLPWLHQKFLPVWLVLVVTTTLLRRRAHRAAWWALLLPQAVTLYLTALYNFAITGSVRPDALFLAWGPAGVTTVRLGQGLLGLLFDARYGIVPYAPVYLLAGAGLLLGGARRLAPVLPAAAVYYLTVASADNWAGAVSNLGRYVMPLAPLLVAMIAIALDRIGSRRGALALALVLAAWTAVFANVLGRDPHAANDSAVLLAKSTFADGNQYVPNLHLRRWSDAAPGLWARVLAWILVVAAVAAFVVRSARGRAGASPVRTLAATAAFVIVSAFGLERWPSPETAPRFHEAIALGNGSTVFLDGPVTVQDHQAVLRAGETRLLVRAPAASTSVRAVLGGRGRVRVKKGATLAARPAGLVVELPLVFRHRIRDGAGREEFFAVQSLVVEGEVLFRFGEVEPGPRE